MRILLSPIVALTLMGCSDDSTSTPAAADTGRADVSVTDTATRDDTAVADTAKADTTIDAAPDAPIDTFDACTEVGLSCSETQPCPGSLICYGFGSTGFCAPPEPQCGGFTMKLCPGGRTCLRASGSSLGYCATDTEKPCVCGKADAGMVDGC